MDFEEAVRMAIENEEKGRKMYLDFTENAKNGITKKTFEFLANEELRHIEKIKEIAEAIKNEGAGVPDLEPTNLEKMKEIFGISVKEFGKDITPGSDDIKAHEMGMGFEKKSYEFYEKLANEATNHELRDFFDSLRAEERDHYKFIEKAYNYIKDPSAFFSEEEGWLLEG